MKVAAIQLEPAVAEVAENLRRCEALGDEAGGSAWWSIPPWPPKSITRRLEASNARTAATVAEAMARAVGAPVIHAAHCGEVVCGLPWTPIRYRGWLQGGAVVSDATGAVLARRDLREGPGVVVAEIEPGRRPPLDEIPDRFWMHRRGAVPALLWEYQKLHGRLWYERHAHGRPTADQLDPALAAPPPAVHV